MTPSRRDFLRAAGVSLALPWLDAFAPVSRLRHGACQTAAAEWSASTRRWACIRRFSSRRRPARTTNSLPTWKSSRTSATTSRSSPACRIRTSAPSHDSSYSFLTAAPHPERRAGFRNTISLDQFAAEHIGGQTRFPSLPLSCEGFGLSWTRSGAVVPPHGFPSSVFAAVPRRAARRSPGPGPPAARRPEHPRHGARPGRQAASRPRRQRPRKARRVLHQRPRTGAAPGPGGGMVEEAQAQGRRPSRRRTSPTRPTSSARRGSGST